MVKGKHWLHLAINIKFQQSSLGDAMWKARCLVKKDIIPLKLENFNELVRQPLFEILGIKMKMTYCRTLIPSLGGLLGLRMASLL